MSALRKFSISFQAFMVLFIAVYQALVFAPWYQAFLAAPPLILLAMIIWDGWKRDDRREYAERQKFERWYDKQKQIEQTQALAMESRKQRAEGDELIRRTLAYMDSVYRGENV